MKVTVSVNGVEHREDIPPRLLLVHFLRGRLGLTGTHVGCDTSQCGACTVHVDGKAVKSCTQFAVQADGCSVITIEGLSDTEDLHPLQQAFHECHGLQCGYCTPGMIMSGLALLQQNKTPTLNDMQVALDGNICRCTGYYNIFKAIELAASRMHNSGTQEDQDVSREF